MLVPPGWKRSWATFKPLRKGSTNLSKRCSLNTHMFIVFLVLPSKGYGGCVIGRPYEAISFFVTPKKSLKQVPLSGQDTLPEAGEGSCTEETT